MSKSKKRVYNSAARQAQAVQTRSGVLEAAKKLFQSEGFESVTIEKIAKAANVSSPTIYALFQSKRGILLALIDEALPVEQYEAFLEEFKEEKSVKARLLMAAKLSRQIYDAERAQQMDVFRGASVLAPEFKELEREREERRYKRQEESVKRMEKEKVLAKGLTLRKAHDIGWAFTGRDMYRMLVVERGWTSKEYEEWLGQMLIKALLS